MRHLTTISLLLIISISLFAQRKDTIPQQYIQSKIINSKGVITILDSIIYKTTFIGKSRYKVLNRNEDGNMTNAIIQIFNEDSEIWTDIFMITKTYYNSGKIHYSLQNGKNPDTQQWTDTFIYKEYDENENMIIEKKQNVKYIKTYTNNNLTVLIKYNLDNETDLWVNNYRELFNYNNGNMTEHIFQKWEITTNEWRNIQNLVYRFDEFGNETVYEFKTWNNSISDWINKSKYIHFYNENKYKTFTITENWDKCAHKWDTTLRISYTYNTNNNLISKIAEQWNPETKEWYFSSFSTHFSYLFDENGNQINKKVQYWNQVTKKWNNANQYISRYDENGDKTQYINQSWDISGNKWKNNTQQLSLFDENRNKIQYTKQKWNVSDNEWNNSIKETFLYSIDNNLIQYTFFNWNNDDFEWDIFEIDKYYWSDFNNSQISDVNKIRFALFPNPATNKIVISSDSNIQIKGIKIFSISGKLLKFEKLNFNNEIDITDLTSGTYFINIQTDESETSIKFIKR